MFKTKKVKPVRTKVVPDESDTDTKEEHDTGTKEAMDYFRKIASGENTAAVEWPDVMGTGHGSYNPCCEIPLGNTLNATQQITIKSALQDLRFAQNDEGPHTTGIKFDTGKPDYSLLPAKALDDVVKILTLGAKKYSRENWRELEDAENRYFAAAMRHMWARRRGETADEESGLDHAAHAICCMLFLAELQHEKNK